MKCLVTTLKETVNNESIPKFGTLRGLLHGSGESSSATIQVSGQTTLTAYSGGLINGSPSRTIQQALTNITFSAGEYMLDINPKYNITYLQYFPMDFNLSELRYNENLQYIRSNDYVEGDVSDLLPHKDTLQRMAVKTLHGDISQVQGFSELVLLRASNKTTSSVYGDIANLGKNPNLLVADLTSKCYGSVDAFVANKVAAGVTDSTQTVTLGRCVLTLNEIDTDGCVNIIWEGTTRIFCFDGAPEGSIENASTIYAKGATEEEVTTWENLGITVIVVD